MENFINNDLNGKLNKLLFEYYQNYYKDELGLPDWESRINLRLNEEEIFSSRFINWIEQWFNYQFANKKVLVVGSGTGGELVIFYNKGAEIYGIEPNENALKISHMKATINNMDCNKITNASSEKLPFDDEKFDFIYCFTVLEHVNDVNKSISEMVRCVKKGGKVFIETPDYRQLFEGHYKLPLPMFLPNWINKIILKLLGRPTGFLNSINKVNSRQLGKIFSNHPVTAIKVYRNYLENKSKPNSMIGKIIKKVQSFIKKSFGIHINQIWLLHKEY